MNNHKYDKIIVNTIDQDEKQREEFPEKFDKAIALARIHLNRHYSLSYAKKRLLFRGSTYEFTKWLQQSGFLNIGNYPVDILINPGYMVVVPNLKKDVQYPFIVAEGKYYVPRFTNRGIEFFTKVVSDNELFGASGYNKVFKINRKAI